MNKQIDIEKTIEPTVTTCDYCLKEKKLIHLTHIDACAACITKELIKRKE